MLRLIVTSLQHCWCDLTTCLLQVYNLLLDLQIPDVSGYEPGQALNVEDLFKVGDMVDIAGTSIGKGFQGMCIRAHTYTTAFA